MSEEISATAVPATKTSKISPLLMIQLLTLCLATSFAFAAVVILWTTTTTGLSDRQILEILFKVLSTLSVAFSAFGVSKLFGIMSRVNDKDPDE